MLSLLAILAASDPAAMRAIAHDYYEWGDRVDPVGSSDQGKHAWDGELADPAAFHERRRHIDAVLAQVKALRTQGWSKDDRVDAVLLRAPPKRARFFSKVFAPDESEAGTPVDE